MRPMLNLAAGIAAALLLVLPAATRAAADCTQTHNPELCEARQKALETCHDKRGAERRQCLTEQMPPPDCSRASQPERCEANLAAQQACKNATGKKHRQCVQNKLKKKKSPAKKKHKRR